MKLKQASLLLALALGLAPAMGSACGETMFRSGMGLRHYAAARQTPARILVVEADGSAQQKYRARLYAGLRRAGHDVVAVSAGTGIDDALTAGQYDLVVARPSEVERLLAEMDAQRANAQANAGSVFPRVIPVLTEDASDGCKLCIHEGAGLGEVLRTINKAMREGS